MKRTSSFLLVAMVLAAPPTTLAQETTWTQSFPASSPSVRYAHGMAYDDARQEVVLFGGAGPGVTNDTWVWNGVTWTQRTPATSPGPTSSHVMAYDAARQRVVLFGGASPTAIIPETWEWDGINWTRRSPATSPSPRLHAGMAYDAARQRTILFGGGPGSPTAFGETWEWDGINWTQRFPVTSPSARSGHALAYDAARGEIVLFGGTVNAVSIFFNDTWVWDGTTWTQRLPATSPTTPRFHHRMAYDSQRQRVVLVGGQGPNNNPLHGDTWVWDGANWTEKPQVNHPPGRTLPAIAYDEARRQAVLFGGFAGAYVNDTWVWGEEVVAIAGPDQVIDEGSAVLLDGSASSGQSLAFSWTQIAGPAVTLNGDTTSQASFTAPLLPGGVGGNQTLTFRLTVSSGGVSHEDTIDVTVKNVNHAPVADAGPTQTVNEASQVALSATNSYDPDGDPIVSYQWNQDGGPTVTLAGGDTAQPSFAAPLLAGGIGGSEILTFTVTASDGLLTAVDSVQVIVEQVNHAPTANAGTDQTKFEDSVVTLNGAISSDPDGDPVTYLWSQVSGPTVVLSNVTSSTPAFTAPAVGPGGALLTFQLVVSDGSLSSSPDEVTVTVQNLNDPPACALAHAIPPTLWPPNHKLVPVGIAGVTDPNNNSITITITSTTQDEPTNGLGDGDSSPDAVIQGGSVLVRAERSGAGNGRVYRIHFTADDGDGGTCSGAVTVSVPHSKKPGGTAVDDGQVYDSTQP